MFELGAAISATRAAMDIVSSAIKARDEKTIEIALQDLRQRLADVSITALNSIETASRLQASLSAAQEENRQLKAKVDEMNRYAMVTLDATTYAYALKPEAKGENEPDHYLCCNCFNRGQKSVLQGILTELGQHWSCHACKWSRTV